MNSISDSDLFEPLKQENKENLNKEALDVIMAYSNQQHMNDIIEDTKLVNKAAQIKVVRKSEGYRRFINKFKK